MILLSFPHSGEEIPSEAFWLQNKDPVLLLSDVDRFVDELYAPILDQWSLRKVHTRIHRYVVDLNRFKTDVDGRSVEGLPIKPDKSLWHGLHWVKTMSQQPLMEAPIKPELHRHLVQKYWEPYHQQIQEFVKKMPKPVLIVDCHSMPSQGGPDHRDTGNVRPDVVVSDFHQTTCDPELIEIWIQAFLKEKFTVSYNWPYQGGAITRSWGAPEKGVMVFQVELNRRLYMNEKTREKLETDFRLLQERLLSVFKKALPLTQIWLQRWKSFGGTKF